MTVKELEKRVKESGIHLAAPGTYRWQDEGCYTAYMNFENACELEEDKNPVTAILKLIAKLGPRATR